MPYAPVLDSRAGEYIMRGAQQASQAIGQGIAEMRKSAREEDYLRGLAPYYFGNKPEEMKKFVESNIGAKRGMITAAQADEHHQQRTMENQFRMADVNARYYEADARDRRAVDDRAHDLQKFQMETEASQPKEIQLGEERMFYTPRTGNVIRQKKPIPAPDGAAEIPVYDGPNNTGNIVAKRVWDPIKGAYDTVDVRARANSLDTLGALLGASGAAAPGAQVKPAAPAGAQFVPGKIYIDGRGNRAKYNADGSWSPVK